MYDDSLGTGNIEGIMWKAYGFLTSKLYTWTDTKLNWMEQKSIYTNSQTVRTNE